VLINAAATHSQKEFCNTIGVTAEDDVGGGGI